MDARPALIAILDDEPEYRRALARLFTACGYACTAYDSGDALLAAAARHRFDCITLDVGLRGRSGLDVLAALRAAQDGPPVIVITGSDNADDEQRARKLSAFAFHRKPVRADVLMPLVARACGR